jgi:hypothetical protein
MRSHGSVGAIPRVTLLLLVWFGVARAAPLPVPLPGATPAPSATRSPASTPTATPELTCQDLWPIVTIRTLGEGRRSKNAQLFHWISGHILDPAGLEETADRIPVCPGTTVSATITDETGPGGSVAALSANMVCAHGTCEVEDISAPESYEATSADGKDTDKIDFIIAR